DGAALWRLECASAEAASGRNVAGYLPDGPDQRRFRKLLNEIQMSWHEHPVNQEREAAGALPINSIWLSGPVTLPALDAWNQALAEGRLALDDSLLDARLRDDREQWLEALRLLDSRLHAWLTAAQPPEILLCGDGDARWLQRRAGGAADWALSLRSGLGGMANLASLWRTLRGLRLPAARGPGVPARAAFRRGERKRDPLMQLFTEDRGS
ncbi:MAG: hypothetical protein ABIP08_12300, partial [Lautropia sp.]